MDDVRTIVKKLATDKHEYVTAQRTEDGKPVLYIRKVRVGTHAMFFD
jgi:hypothetical protein